MTARPLLTYVEYLDTGTLCTTLATIERNLLTLGEALSTDRRRLLNSIRLDIIQCLRERQMTLSDLELGQGVSE